MNHDFDEPNLTPYGVLSLILSDENARVAAEALSNYAWTGTPDNETPVIMFTDESPLGEFGTIEMVPEEWLEDEGTVQ